MRNTKDGITGQRAEVARKLADAHFESEPAIQHIFRYRAAPADEDRDNEPIKLLEVNDETIPVGIQPVYFGPHPGSKIFFPSAIIEITAEEYKRLLSGDLQLPEQWKIRDDEYARPAPLPASQS